MITPMHETHYPPRVVIVEDEAITALDLRYELMHLGYDVCGIADNAARALQLSRETLPDLVLMDIRLAEGDDGIETARKIREMHDAAIVFLTAHSDEQTLARAINTSPEAFLLKPLQQRDLRTTIEVALEQRRRNQDHLRLIGHLKREENHLRTINQALTELTVRDPLTDLANRRGLIKAMHREWRRLSREQRPMAIVILDIDDFKLYNDHYGHTEGDQCLRTLGKVLKDSCQRSGDVACRFGGEEFILLLPDTDAQDACRIAEDALDHLRALKIPHAHAKAVPFVTFSAGVASVIPTIQGEPDTLITAADNALYRAKAQGRNRVCL